MIEDFTAWRKEMLFTGAIVQDEDSTVESAEAELRCTRYIELHEQVEGSEGQEVFQTLIDSMRVEEDYEVYEWTLTAAFSFPLSASEIGCSTRSPTSYPGTPSAPKIGCASIRANAHPPSPPLSPGSRISTRPLPWPELGLPPSAAAQRLGYWSQQA